MGRQQIEALIRVLQQQLARDKDNLALGTWSIRYEGLRRVFLFDKCQLGGYCEERPAVIGLDGAIMDPGGPVLTG